MNLNYALITGASSGIGAAFAQTLAVQQVNLVLVARSQERLDQLSHRLQAEYGIQTLVIAQDLTTSNAVENVYRAVEAQGWSIDLLVNNAGFGDYGAFAQRSLSRQLAMINLNIGALVEMTGLYLPQMQQRGFGGIINVTSITAFQPIPYLAVYSASKAFILNFSQALWAENRHTGVKILAVCPGPTRTDFFVTAEMERHPTLLKAQTYEDPEDVVRQALQALAAGQPTVVTGSLSNQAIVHGSRVVSRQFLLNLLEPRFRPPD